MGDNDGIFPVYDVLLGGGLLFDRNITPMVIVDSDRVMVKANHRFCALFGYAEEELLGRATSMLTPSLEHFHTYKRYFQRTSEGSFQSSELQYRKKSGELFWVKLTGIPLSTEVGQFLLWSFDDITNEVRAREEIRDRYRELEIIFEKVRAGLVFVVDGSIERVNDAFLSMVGEPKGNVQGRHIADFLDCFEECSKMPSKMTVRFSQKDGQTVITEREIVPVSENSQLVVFVDLTEHLREKESLRKKSMLDGMTGIFNRTAFVQAAEVMLSDPGHEAVSLILFDIDHFKRINDSHGHGIGDDVLTELVEMIKGQLRRGEIFGRLGGEEFGILLPIAHDSALLIAERLLFSIRRQRFTSRKLEVTVSMGLVDSSFSTVFDEMFKEADRFLYIAKKNGRNRLESPAGTISQP